MSTSILNVTANEPTITADIITADRDLAELRRRQLKALEHLLIRAAEMGSAGEQGEGVELAA